MRAFVMSRLLLIPLKNDLVSLYVNIMGLKATLGRLRLVLNGLTRGLVVDGALVSVCHAAMMDESVESVFLMTDWYHTYCNHRQFSFFDTHFIEMYDSNPFLLPVKSGICHSRRK